MNRDREAPEAQDRPDEPHTGDELPRPQEVAGAGAGSGASSGRDADRSPERGTSGVRGEELPVEEALARAVYGYWCHSHNLPRAIAAVAAEHPDAKVREAAEFDFVPEALLAYCVGREREERAAG